NAGVDRQFPPSATDVELGEPTEQVGAISWSEIRILELEFLKRVNGLFVIGQESRRHGGRQPQRNALAELIGGESQDGVGVLDLVISREIEPLNCEVRQGDADLRIVGEVVDTFTENSVRLLQLGLRVFVVPGTVRAHERLLVGVRLQVKDLG